MCKKSHLCWYLCLAYILRRISIIICNSWRCHCITFVKSWILEYHIAIWSFRGPLAIHFQHSCFAGEIRKVDDNYWEPKILQTSLDKQRYTRKIMELKNGQVAYWSPDTNIRFFTWNTLFFIYNHAHPARQGPVTDRNWTFFI